MTLQLVIEVAIVDPYELVGLTFLMDPSCRRSPVKGTQVRLSEISQFQIRLWQFLIGWCEWYPDAAGAEVAEAGLLESKGYCFPCQHLIHIHGASSNAFTVFYAAATALKMPV
jgi:hypothetical protein